MSDQPLPQAGDTPAADIPNTPPAPPDAAPVDGTTDWLTRELKEARKEAAKYRTKARDLEKAAETAQRKQLEEQGNWQKLYEQAKADLESIQTEASQSTAYKQAFEAVLQARIASIPEVNRGLIPTDYDPIKLSNWLDANWERLGARRFPNLDAGAGGRDGASSGAKPLTAEAMALAKKLNIDPAKLAT
jgi:hypothetical protein